MQLPIKASTGRLLIVAATAALAIGLTAGPAAAATTWTITPGGRFTGVAGKTTLKDGSSTPLTCNGATIAGTFKPGRKKTDPIGEITAMAFNSCSGPLGFTFTVSVSGLPWSIHARSYNAATGTTTGTITGLRISLSGSGCSATLGAATSGSPITANFSYTNSTHILKITPPSSVHWWNVNGCFGLISNGDPGSFSFGNGFVITPPQKITSP